MTDEPLFFSDWDIIGRTVLLGILSYASVVALLRVSGKRTLSKMNMFDFVITIAFGSVLASMLISKNVALAQGITAFAVLIALQFVVTYTSVRSERFEGIVKGEPTLLYYRGRWFEDRMRQQRVSQDEMYGAARAQGLGGMSEVGAIVLETNGDLSVVKAGSVSDGSTLPDADGREPDQKG